MPFALASPARRYKESLKAPMASFWDQQEDEIDDLEIGTEQSFKNHNDLPLARIKRIMKSDEDVRMISAEAPVLFAKACEMFILEITLKSWVHSELSKRKTLQKEDMSNSIKVRGRWGGEGCCVRPNLTVSRARSTRRSSTSSWSAWSRAPSTGRSPCRGARGAGAQVYGIM
jgi:histone H3/H4